MTKCSNVRLVTSCSILRRIGYWGDFSVPTGVTLVDDESCLLRNGFQGVFAVVHANGHRIGLVVVPAQTVHEKAFEVKVL